MPPYRLTALAIARALLDGPRAAPALGQRLADCVAAEAAWAAELVARCERLPDAQWSRLADRTLADWLARDPAFRAPWQEGRPPRIRRWILREASGMAPLPAGLAGCSVPYWPHTGALAAWLGLSTGGLWRLCLPTAWQRRCPLGEQHYRQRLLAKPSGGWRLLEVPEPYLRATQRRLLDDLLDRIPAHEAACGYVRERSVVDHARAHAGQAVLLKFDLQDFFATVRASRVHAIFETLGYSGAVARALTALCTTATPEPVLERLRHEGGLTWTQAQRLRDPHLPQGAPSSAALANLCAFGFDVRVAAFARTLGARYTRYADDLVLSGTASLRAARPRIEARIAAIAREEGFALNHRKTRCLGQARRQQVCGIVVNAGTRLPRAEFDRLKAILHACVRDGPAAQNRAGHPDWRAHLRGRIAWAAQLNAPKAARLERLFAQIRWD
jgi:RNA-directed DNA polymerase